MFIVFFFNCCFCCYYYGLNYSYYLNPKVECIKFRVWEESVQSWRYCIIYFLFLFSREETREQDKEFPFCFCRMKHIIKGSHLHYLVCENDKLLIFVCFKVNFILYRRMLVGRFWLYYSQKHVYTMLPMKSSAKW